MSKTEKQVYAICKRSGAVVHDDLEGQPVFYLSNNPKWLKKYVGAGETIKLVSKSTLERAWIFKSKKGRVLRPAHGIVLATTKKSTAKMLAEICQIAATPTLYS
jgi:hypothetical protein